MGSRARERDADVADDDAPRARAKLAPGLRVLTRWLDDAIPIPGTPFRIGLDGLLGLIPGFGDVAGGIVSAWFLIVGARLGAPPSLLLRMAGNIGVDALLGAVPVVGDVFDFTWRANRKNLALLERHLADPAAARRSSRLWVAGAVTLALLLVALLLVGAFLAATALVRWVRGLA